MIETDDKLQVSAAIALVSILWFISDSRFVCAIVGCAIGAILHAQYQKYRVKLRLLEWKVRCRVRHWFTSLFTQPNKPTKQCGPRHIPKPHLDA